MDMNGLERNDSLRQATLEVGLIFFYEEARMQMCEHE